ncbi:alpha-amylase family glycosyl hydrolase [Brevundimonas sp. Root1279]|uniref:alpha-amylase family glycosyl hydrolase n=1 Tax=Brevundimonas sp. Root1279 TaxID=1736443 RepID=UPI0007013ABF|nr:alpha-amylase family glycosyl hydrolase [Brevundimonas sp. Root1279]KQW82992.1 alpha-amylase [Brevundimonas sp. Root1279]
MTGSVKRPIRGRAFVACALLATLAAAPALAQTTPALQALRERPAEDEVIYFVLPDRFADGDAANNLGGLSGDRLATGYDPTDPGFYHGGDLRGLMGKLDYLQGMGVTALWLAPVFENKPVQGPPGHQSSAYHGYWITDFTRVDPHFGTNDDFRALVDAAHARGMKVYLDIVINHTADVIQYRECPQNDCGYRWKGDYPYSRRGGLTGEAINEGFTGAPGSDFSRMTSLDYAYTPYVPAGEETRKKPDWLNDPANYHNRGNSAWYSEARMDGDFAGLDDLFTEKPDVVQGFIDVYGAWIDDYGIDGYRIDTARHVNPEFWQVFSPAILERARAKGIPNFHIFGETYDFTSGTAAMHTVVDGLPTVLDFAYQRVVQNLVTGKGGGPADMGYLLMEDPIYAGGEATARKLPTFTGNHDMGRIGHLILKDMPDVSDAELLDRAALAHALVILGRGVPVIYYGDEQGFTGDGDDRRARQDMFETRVGSYADDRRIGAASETFDANADMYRRIAEMTRARAADARLRHGRVVTRTADQEPGILALSRLDDDGETLVVFNTSTEARDVNVAVELGSAQWRALLGQCPARSSAPGSVSVSVPALGYIVCVSEG